MRTYGSCITCAKGLLSQLPRGPVRELCLYAPFLDPTGQALADILGWFDPERTIIGIQENWTSYDGDAVLRAGGSRQIEIRILAERFPRHGKLLEWEAADGRHALTGSANLTRSALTRATVDGGNCELAVLTPVRESLMPEGTVTGTGQLQGRRTVSENTARPGDAPAGCAADPRRAGGDTGPSLRRGRDDRDVPGRVARLLDRDRRRARRAQSEAVFTIPGSSGAVVRAVAVLAGQARAESPRCSPSTPPGALAARPTTTGPVCITPTPKKRSSPTRSWPASSAMICSACSRVNVEQPARQSPETAPPARPFRRAPRTAGPPTSRSANAASAGRSPPACSARSPSLMPEIRPGIGWSISDDDPADDDDDDEPAAGMPRTAMRIRPSERARGGTGSGAWCSRWPPASIWPPLLLTLQAARIMIQLLAHGVWDLEDQSWRDLLAELAVHLIPDPAEDIPAPAWQLAAALGAICMGLLRGGVSLTGGTPSDVQAARTWRRVKLLVAEADPDLASDLLIPPIHARAIVLNLSELEDTILLAMDDDPASVLIGELAEHGWNIERAGPVYCVNGAFTNPVTVAARVATQLGEHQDLVLVHARAASGWAFIAWRRPDLVLAHVPGNTWRHYRIDGLHRHPCLAVRRRRRAPQHRTDRPARSPRAKPTASSSGSPGRGRN